MINTGYLEGTSDSGALVVRVYYDATADPTGPQSLIDGPRGYCLDVANTSGHNRRVTLTLPNGTTQDVTFGQGDPVSTGPASGRSRTAAQMAALGFTLRSDVSGFELGE